MGLPCPNLGTGGYAFHGPYEHTTAEGMDEVTEILLNIVSEGRGKVNPRIPAAAAAVCGLCGLAAYAFSERLKIVHYTVKSRNAGGRTRFLHVSDLHGSDFGEELYRRTDELSPDAVMMTGDIADNRIPNEKAFALTEYIGKRFPAFYVSGNHEIYTHDADGIKNRLRSQGITVLEGEGTMLTAGGSSFLICGIDDPYGFPDRKGRLWEDRAFRLCGALPERHFLGSADTPPGDGEILP